MIQKKRSIILALLIHSIQALPIGNPADPSILEEGFFIPDTIWSQPRVGYIQDFLFSCKLRNQTSDVKHSWVKGRAELFTVTWSILDRLNLDLILGTGKNTFHFQNGNFASRVKVQSGLVWGGMGKFVLFEVKDTTLSLFGMGGGYNWMKGTMFFTQNGSRKQTVASMKFWQAGMAVTQKLGFFFPYLGVAFFQSSWDLASKNERLFYFEEKHSLGPFLGCSLTNGSKFLINVEGRCWFENGCSISAEVRF